MTVTTHTVTWKKKRKKEKTSISYNYCTYFTIHEINVILF